MSDTKDTSKNTKDSQLPQKSSGLIELQKPEGTPVQPARPAIAQIPAGGLPALAAQLWPDEKDDKEKMYNRKMELYRANTDVLRDEDNYLSGQIIRIP